MPCRIVFLKYCISEIRVLYGKMLITNYAIPFTSNKCHFDYTGYSIPDFNMAKHTLLKTEYRLKNITRRCIRIKFV